MIAPAYLKSRLPKTACYRWLYPETGKSPSNIFTNGLNTHKIGQRCHADVSFFLNFFSGAALVNPAPMAF